MTAVSDSNNGSGETSTLDPITLEVLWNSFKATADMMGISLWRTAYSTIVRDARDCSAGLCDVRGRLVAQADLIPALSGIMHLSLKVLLAKHMPLASIHPGDVLIMNHPYYGGTHTSDIMLYSPIFVGDEIVAFAVSIAHHIDLGSMQATGIARATDLYQEGLLIPPMKLYQRRQLNQTLWTMIEKNVRYPKEVLGDLRAQIAANTIGVREVTKLVDKYGKNVVVQAMAGVIEYGERMVRAELEKIPDGEYEGEGHLDDDGINRDEPVKIKVKVIIKGSDITFDFTGTSPQRRGNINTPPNAIMNALGYATKCISDTELPENEGTFLPIKSIQPPGTIVNPHMPAAVLMRHELVQRVADTIVQALAPAVPDRICAASCGNTNTFTIVSPHGIHYSNLGGGFGATALNDGMSAIQVHLSKCMGVTVEDIELGSGTVVERFELRRDSGGPGEQRGGLGVRMDVRIQGEPAVLALSSDAETTAPPGLFGGMSGLPGRKYVTRQGTHERLYRKATNFRMEPGTVLSFQTPGGGGYGDPLTRSPEKVRGDVLDGFITQESARDDYGVILDEHFELDLAATERARAELAAARPQLPRAVKKLLESESIE